MLSKEVRFPTAIESLKGIVFDRNICTPAGWRKSFTGSVMKLQTSSCCFAEAKQFKRLFYCLQVLSKARFT